MAEWLKSLSLVWGKIIAIVFFVSMIIWAWFRPRSFIFHEAPNTRRWRDLRIWAAVFLGLQIIIYLIF
ncbi:MAG: hypothetical protein ACETWK_06790 [Candidatus Aminicenantaceae bacterium]